MLALFSEVMSSFSGAGFSMVFFYGFVAVMALGYAIWDLATGREGVAAAQFVIFLLMAACGYRAAVR